MTRPRHNLTATVATALLAVALGVVSPAAADGAVPGAVSHEQGTYATPAAEPSAPDTTGSGAAVPSQDGAAADPEPSLPASDPTPSTDPAEEEPPAPQPTVGSWVHDPVGWSYVLSDGTRSEEHTSELQSR